MLASLVCFDRLFFIILNPKETIMSISTNKTTIALAASAALTAGLALSPMTVSAEANPFASTELSSGYMQLAEGKCGGEMKGEHEAKCGGEMKDKAEKMKEGKCGEAKCGADKKAEKMKEGKCGEAKCGADKK
jgi:uncharacterized low-complexity protein